MDELEMMRAALLEGGLVEGVDFEIYPNDPNGPKDLDPDCPFRVTYRSLKLSPIIYRALQLTGPDITPCYDCWNAGIIGPDQRGCEHTNATTH